MPTLSREAYTSALAAGLADNRPGPLSVRSAPSNFGGAPPEAPSPIATYGVPALGALALGAAGFFLFPKHAPIAAAVGALVGGAGAYFAFAPPTPAA